MRQLVHRTALVGMALTCLGLTSAAVAQTAKQGDVVQSVGSPISQGVNVPPLHLSDDQKSKIQQALRSENTEVTFGTKTTKPTQSFNPTVGAKIPTSLKPHTLPPPVTSQIPELKRYTYLKFKQQVLIINPMTGKIVDVFPET